MALEIETKVKVDSLQPVRERLQQLGARRKGERLEVNIYFDTASGELLASDRGLRLRCLGQENFLTYKGPRQPGSYKQREEIQTQVQDAAATRAILEALNLRQTLLFEKRRESWQLEPCLVELDTVAILGCYVEVEGASEQEIAAALRQLHLDRIDPENRTYPVMLQEHLRKSANLCREIRLNKSASGPEPC